MSDNVSIALVSKKKLGGMSSKEKVAYILGEVKQDKILVLEQGLDAAEAAQLIERTMVEIDPDSFIGIEMDSYSEDKDRPAAGDNTPKAILAKLRSKAHLTRRPSMTVVGPADRLKTIAKDGSSVQALILGGERRTKRSRA